MGAQRQGVRSQLPPAPTEFNRWLEVVLMLAPEYEVDVITRNGVIADFT